ncbi:MAG: RNA methyltransferase [Oscillatoriales cyanobacterium]|uniref:RNA methyltransferase n=1 Tax=Microcoleus anatoxicus PTRS2 TaxID=2705321 RepID=A0ABU8YNS4_9CYAN|nr:MAG: RNA methyltransferase [Oscillatoriales cyanobacterium]TAE00934.1 MAG: RNA methyltransferase [Oscillatoriales cyanobacterium]
MLTSIQNPLVKEIRKLHSSKGRREQQLFLLEGTHLLEEACGVNYPLATVCSTPEWVEQHGKLWELACSLADRTELVNRKVLESIATTVQPDGIVATARRTATPPAEFSTLGIALETIQDPGNLGAIVRTAAAANADGLLLSADSADLDHPKVLRASAGAWFKLPMTVSPDLMASVSRSKNRGMQILATVPDATLTYWEVDLRLPTLIVLGNEGSGLSGQLRNLADRQIQIPLSRGVESLNVSIASALILYEAQRQRSYY